MIDWLPSVPPDESAFFGVDRSCFRPRRFFAPLPPKPRRTLLMRLTDAWYGFRYGLPEEE